MKFQFSSMIAGIKNLSRRNRAFGPLAVLGAALVFAAFLAFLTDWYPIMSVDGSLVTARRFNKNIAAANIYYQNLVKSAANDATTTAMLKDVKPSDLEVGVLDQLVVAELVHNEARREVGSDLPELVTERLNQAAINERIKSNAEILYGLKYDDFYSEVLIPQTEQDILSGRLYLRNKNFQDWLAEARKSASVKIFSSRFRWDGQKVVIN